MVQWLFVCWLVRSFLVQVFCIRTIYAWQLSFMRIYLYLFSCSCFCFPCCGMFSFFVFAYYCRSVVDVVVVCCCSWCYFATFVLLLLCLLCNLCVCVRVSFCFCNFYQSHKSCTHIVSLSLSIDTYLSFSGAHYTCIAVAEWVRWT